MNIVSDIVGRNLCVSCGACRAVCGKKAIEYKRNNGLYVPFVDESLCSSCGLCTKVCPSSSVDVSAAYGSWDYGIGTKCFEAYAKDDHCRQNTASGGIVSAMVGHLLESGKYDFAYLLEYESYEGQAALQKRDPNYDVLKSARSKYIPASVENVIEDIKCKRLGRTIIVCTPCQLLAIERALNLYHQDRSQLLIVGLFCDMTMNYNVYSYYEYKYGRYSWFHFRDKNAGGWPGDTMLGAESGAISVSRQERMALKPYFQLNRCSFCFDKLNMCADISVGDCYIQGNNDPKGKSSVIIRTPVGMEVWNECANVIETKYSSFEVIAKSQHLSEKVSHYHRNSAGNGPFLTSNDFQLPVVNVKGKEHKSDGIKAVVGRHMASRFEYLIFVLTKKCLTFKEIITSSKLFTRIEVQTERLKKLFSFRDRNFYVFIDNPGGSNKGDHLMIDACINEIYKYKPEARIVVSLSFWRNNGEYCDRKNVLPLYFQPRKMIARFNRFIYWNILGRNDYVTPGNIDVVLSVRGYAFGDKWNPDSRNLSADRVFFDSFTKKNRRIYFLPQAFGPFKQEYSIKQIKYLYGIADKLYPRDCISMKYVSDIVGDSSKLLCVPDFTMDSLPSSSPSVQLPSKSYVTIILNARMMDKTSDRISSAYIDTFIRIINHLLNKGEKVVLLNHEGSDDEDLMQSVNSRINSRVPVLTKLSAADIKAVILNSKLVISSRFHGVVSTLVQGVPVLCTSWSHKYQELLKDHRCEASILDITDEVSCVSKVDDALTNPDVYSSKPGCLEHQRELVESMWKEILVNMS